MKVSQKNQMDLLQTVLQGRLEFFRSTALHHSLTCPDFHETPKCFMYSSGIPFAPCNGIIEKNESQKLSEQDIEEAIQFFNAKKLPFIWWSSEKILENKGFQFGGILKGIALDISENLPTHPSLPHFKVKLVQTDEELKNFTQVVLQSFGLDNSLFSSFLKSFTSGYKKGEQLHFLGYDRDIPASCLTLSTCSQSAGIWSAGTLPEYRRRGLFTALSQAALIEAKKRQYKQVMAILMPKGMAWGPFQQLGFEEVCNFPFYVYGTNASELE
jgi:GNAT superfamily N-acetyltransferase